MRKQIEEHFTWALFAMILMVTFAALETQGLDTAMREQADVSTKSAWIEKQTQAIDRGQLGQLSNLQRVLQFSRGPSSVADRD